MDAIDLEEGQHHVHTDSLVSVDERMVGDQRITQTGALFLFGRIEFFSAEAGEGRFQRGFQQSFIPDADAAAGLLCDQLMQEQDLVL